MHACVCAGVAVGVSDTHKGPSDSLELGVTCMGARNCPLEEQEALFPAETSLQPLSFAQDRGLLCPRPGWNSGQSSCRSFSTVVFPLYLSPCSISPESVYVNLRVCVPWFLLEKRLANEMNA